MTRDVLRNADRTLADALDNLPPPPPLRRDFAERVVAEARRRESTASPRPLVRRRWMRGRGIAIGALALAVTSAAAAGIGAFEPLGVRVPAIEQLVKKVTGIEPIGAREPKPRHIAPAAKVEELAKAPRSAPPRIEDHAAAAQVEQPPEPRREQLAQVIASRAERRIERRDRLGLAVPPRVRDLDRRPAAQMATRDAGRAALIARTQQIRATRVEAPAPPASSEPLASQPARPVAGPVDRFAATDWQKRIAEMRSLAPASRRAFFEHLDPEQRQQLLNLRAERRLGNRSEQRDGRLFQRRGREGIGRHRR